MRHTMTYDAWDVVTVPFPFTDKTNVKQRPALVLNKSEYQIKTGHILLLMITSAANSNWYSDINIEDLITAGLKKSSIVRFKIFSLDERLIIKKIGVLSTLDIQKVRKNLLNILDI
jgi:mRNA interferase MazF